MKNGLDLSTIMPILVAIIILIIAVLLITAIYKTKAAQSVNTQSFEKLAQKLMDDNKILKSELESIKETLNSINKMMKEIE